jgi:C_GCAxxG_C_C family probable redox protein
MTSLDAEQAKAETLARFKQTGDEHINCAQAVLCYALLRMDGEPECIAAAGYMGGGIVGMGEICGTMNGTALALGMRDLLLEQRGVKEPPFSADELLQTVRDFVARFGSCRCRELTDWDLTTQQGRDAFHESEVSGRCADYVSWACDRLEPLLQTAAPDA